MSVQREELLPFIFVLFTRSCVPQYHQWSVVQLRRIFCKQMHRAIERRMDRRSWFNKKVQAQMNRSTFFAGRGSRTEHCRTVEQARLIISSDADRGVLRFHFPEQCSRKCL